MKNKRILSFALSLCLIFLLAAPFSAAAAGGDDEIVANMYLCHRRSSAAIFGHCWVYIENLTDETLQVGAYRCPPGQGVSVGNWFITRSDGNGIYYNVEAYVGNVYGTSGMSATKDTLTRAELEKVSRRAAEQNVWGLFRNCSFYAAAVWNAGSSKKVIPFFHPTVVWLQILIHGNVGAVPMYFPARDQVLRQVGTGLLSTTYVVSNGTVSKQI